MTTALLDIRPDVPTEPPSTAMLRLDGKELERVRRMELDGREVRATLWDPEDAARPESSVPLSFSPVDGGYLVEEQFTEVYGFGPTPNEAFDDFVHALIEYRQVLSAERGRLAPRLRDHLAFIDAMLERANGGG